MKKRYKILIIGAVLLIILVVIAQFYANSFLQKLMRQEINTFVAEQEGNYFIEVDKITSQILLKRFVLSGIKVHSNDTLPINRDNSFTIDLERLVVKLDGISDIFKDGTLKLKTIKLDHPQINYTYKVKTDSDTVPVKEEFKSDQLKKIQLRSFEIVNGQFHLNKYKDSTSTSVATVFNVDFEMNDIFLSLEETKIERKLTFEELQADLGNIVYHDAENHDISCSNLYFSNDDKVISFVDFEIKDKASLERVKNDFSIKRPWIESKIKQLDIKLDLQKIKQKELDFQLIEMKDLDVYVFHNKKDSSTFSFEHFLASIPFPFNVDTLKVEKTDLDLSLINKEGKNDDFLINELQMEIQHISNKESYTQMHPRIIGQLESKLWKKGYIKADFNYNQLSQQFTSKLRLKEFPEQKLIRFANTSDIAIIKRGNIKDWDLEIAKDSSHIEGNFKAHVNNLDMEYNDFPEHANLNSINTKIGKLNIISSFYKNKDKPIDILIDSIYMDSPRIVFNAKKGSSEKNPKKNDQKKINKEQKKPEGLINIQSIDIRNASFNYKKQGIKEDVLSIESFSIQDRFLAIDLSKEGIDKLTKTGTYKINASHFEYFDPPSNYLSFKDASINKKDNTLSLTGLRFKDKTSKKQFHESSAEGNDWKSAYIEKVNVDIDLDMLLKKEVHCSKVTFIKPILTHIQAVDRKAKELRKTNSDFSLPISIDVIEIVDADVDFRIKKKDEKEFEIFDLSHLNGSFKNLQINSASNSSRFSGSIHARFYDQSEIDVFVSHDFMRKNASSHIKGKARNISLSTLKDKLAFFQKIDLKEGHIAAVEFNIDINNKNAEGILIVDTLSVSEYKLSKDPNGDFLSLTMNEIKSSFTIPAKKNIFVSKIEIINPEVDIHYIPAKNSISTKETKKRSPIFVEKGKFNSLFKIEKIKVENATLKHYTGATKNSPLFTVNLLNIDANKIELYDSTDTSVPISIMGLDIGMNNIVVHSFPLFDLTVEHMTLDIETQKAKLSAIHFHNKKPADTFFKGLKYRKPYIDLKVPEVELEIELKGFFSSHPHIKKAIISEAVFKTIVNAELPVSPEEKPLPNRMLANSDFPITVDSIFVEDSQLNIEFIDQGPKNGLLQFNDVQALVTNLTTDPAAVEKNNIMTWDFYSTLWETGTNHIVVNYELDSENDAFIMYGRCDDMNLVDTDTLTASLYGIKVNDGILYHTYFEIEGNNDEAVGTISFDYENLKLSLDKKKKNVKGSEELKKVKKKDKLNQSFVKSMIVNGLLSKKNIPDTQKYIPAGTAYFQREKNKPIFHLMWYSISSGILEIAEARVVKDIRNFNSMFKKNKLEKGKSD